MECIIRARFETLITTSNILINFTTIFCYTLTNLQKNVENWNRNFGITWLLLSKVKFHKSSSIHNGACTGALCDCRATFFDESVVDKTPSLARTWASDENCF
jgi:hypothetical protein